MPPSPFFVFVSYQQPFQRLLCRTKDLEKKTTYIQPLDVETRRMLIKS